MGQHGRDPIMGEELHKVQTICHAEPLGFPFQCFPLRAVAHEEYLGARVLQQASSLNQGAHSLLGSEPTDEQNARLTDARERILERPLEERGVHSRWDDVNAVLINTVREKQPMEARRDDQDRLCRVLAPSLYGASERL